MTLDPAPPFTASQRDPFIRLPALDERTLSRDDLLDQAQLLLMRERRRADLGALNGHGNARSVMQMLRVISLGGEAGGVRLLSPETISLIFDQQADGIDLVLGLPIRWGTGFALPRAETLPDLPQDGGAGVLLGRLADRDGPGAAADGRLHDEPDGTGHPRFGPQRGLRPRPCTRPWAS